MAYAGRTAFERDSQGWSIGLDWIGLDLFGSCCMCVCFERRSRRTSDDLYYFYDMGGLGVGEDMLVVLDRG